jgi:hypothetical protein
VLRKAAGAAFASMLLVLTVQVPQAAADDGAEFCGHHVQGAILAKYQELGGEKSPLGCPQTDELTTPDGVGRYNTFAGGSIYWSPDTDAHPVWGVIGDKWGAMGWEGGSLGYPASDELTNPDGEGKRQKFQRGTIYWHPTASNGAHAVSGKIGWVWSAYQWESGYFGYPTSDVQWDKENKENYQKFSGNHFIFHSPNGNGIEACQKECAGYYGTAPDPPADPEANLINQTRVEFPLDDSIGDWKDTFVVRAWPTREGRLAGRALVPREWDQMWQRAPKPWGMTDDKSESVYKQLACHAVYAAPRPDGGWLGGYSWDLESWRPNISWAKALTPLTNNKCNWED